MIHLLALVFVLILPGLAAAQLSVNKIHPQWAAPGQTKNVTIIGSGFSAPVAVTMGEGITVNGTPTVVSSEEITASITVSASPTTGTRDVRVTTTSDGKFHERLGLLAVWEAFTLKGNGTNGSGFTASERVAVQDGVGGVEFYLATMMGEIGTHPLAAAGTTPAQRAAFFTAMTAVYRAQALTQAFLLHTDRSSTVPAATSSGVGASPGARSVWVSNGTTQWTSLFTAPTSGALYDLYTALLVLRDATTDSLAREAFNRAATLRVGQALGTHANTNFNHPYATPYPDDICVGTLPTISCVRTLPQLSAVHGFYRQGQWGLYRTQHEMANVMEQIGVLVGLDQVDLPRAATVLSRIPLAITRAFAMSMNYAGLPAYAFGPVPGRPNMNPRFNVAVEGPRLLTDKTDNNTTVARFHEINVAIGEWVVTGLAAQTARGAMLTATSRAWALGNDHAAWSSIAFNANLIPTSIGQAGDRQGEVLVDVGRYSFTKMEPPSFRPGTSMTVTITGVGFENGMVPVFTRSVGSSGTMGVSVDNFSVVSSTQIVARITASAGATPGFRDLTLSPPAPVSAVPTTAIQILTVGDELALKGGFTAGELATPQNIYNGVVQFANGMKAATVALGAAGLTRAQMQTISLHAAGVIEDTFKGVGYLIHAEASNNSPTNGCLSDGFDGPTLTGAPRSSWVAVSRFHIDRVRGTNLSGNNGGLVNHLGSLTTALTAAIAAASDAGVKATLTTVRDTNIAAAITAFNAADMTPTFAFPFPDDLVGNSAPSVVHIGLQTFTVHGCYRVAQQMHARGVNYLFEPGEFYLSLILNATFTTWQPMKDYKVELFTQFPLGIEQWFAISGIAVVTVNPPPGPVFSNMNPRMAQVARMWDVQTNIAEVEGFAGGPTTSLNASLNRMAISIAGLYVNVNMPASHSDLENITAKWTDSWRNHAAGLGLSMIWHFVAPRSPTTRAFDFLPSTAPAITSANTVTTQSGQAMTPFIITTTGSRGAGVLPHHPAVPLVTVASGTLPTGVSLVNFTGVEHIGGTHTGVAQLSGAPTSGSETFTLRASNGTDPDFDQVFTMTVSGSAIVPTFTTRAEVTFTVGHTDAFAIRVAPASGVTLSMTGTLPPGLTFTADPGNGTATIIGAPVSLGAGTYAIIATATNASGEQTQNITIRVKSHGKRGGGQGVL